MDDPQELLIQGVIRSQSDYVNVVDPATFLHSMMQNAFYKNLSYIIQQEWQYVIDYVNELKTFYNIDYYDGDQTAFLDKIQNIFSVFGYSAPTFFIPYTNIENGDMLDLTKQNDFLRNMTKHIWLQRRWAGTLNGYNLLCRLLNRLGAVHIGVQYTSIGYTGKIYRLFDESKLIPALPGGGYYPDSVNILGAAGFSKIKPGYRKWDTGFVWSETQGITFDDGVTGITISSVSQNSQTFTLTVTGIGTSDGTILINNISIPIAGADRATIISIAAKIASYMSSLAGTRLSVSYEAGDNFILFTTDPLPISWDAAIPYSVASKSLLVEIGLDRILNFTNTSGNEVSLLDNVFLDALAFMLPNVRRAADIVHVGSQLTLVTSKDGTYNTLSYPSDYTHSNIQAKFQTFLYRTDKITPAWSSGDNIDYIKIGTGGFRDSTVENTVFVPTGQDPVDPAWEVLTDLKNPLFQTKIGVNEKDNFGGFNFINVVVHPRTIEDLTANNTLLINGVNTSLEKIAPTHFQAEDIYISEGSVALGINFDNEVPLVSFDPQTTAVTLVTSTEFPNGIHQITPQEFYFTINTGTDADDIGNPITIADVEIIMVGNNRTPSQVASDIVAGFPSNTGWTLIVSDAKVSMHYYLPTIHQRILVYEQNDPVNSSYNSLFKYQERESATGSYTDFADQSLLDGYCIDPSYTASNANYFPTIQKSVVNLLPLTIADQYSSLSSEVVAKYTAEETSIGITFNGLSTGITATVVQSGISYTFTVTGTGTTNGNIQINSTLINITNRATVGDIADAIASISISTFTKTHTGGTAVIVYSAQAIDYSVNYTTAALNGNNGTTINIIEVPGVNGIYFNALSTGITSILTQTGDSYDLEITGVGTVGNILLNFTEIPITNVSSVGVIADAISAVSQSGFSITHTAGNSHIIYEGIRASYAFGFNGTTGQIVVPQSASLNDLNKVSVNLFYNCTAAGAVTNAVLAAKEASMGGTSGWGLYYTYGGGTSVTFTFRYEQPYSSLQWTATADLPLFARVKGWHQITVSYNGTDIPIFLLDGLILPVTQIAPLPSLSGGTTGTVFSTPKQSNARLFEFKITTAPSSSGNISVGGVSVAVLSTDTTAGVATKIVAASGNDWSAVSVSNEVFLTFSETLGTDTNPLYLGGFGSQYFTGILDEITIYDRALTVKESQDSFYSVPLKHHPLLSSKGNQQYTFIDHEGGKVVMKLQYNPIGPYAPLSKALNTYTNELLATSIDYSVNISNKQVAITEMGLFDTSNILVAYATFPPIIYNPAIYHLAFNLFISL